MALEMPSAWKRAGSRHDADVMLRMLLLSLSALRAVEGCLCSSLEHPLLWLLSWSPFWMRTPPQK